MQQHDNAFLAPLFLGLNGENGPLLERLLVDFMRDHVYWRRNFHPTDPPAVTVPDRITPEFSEAVARLEQELNVLSANLKKSIPVFSPRYVGHMCSDLLLPGLLAQLVTTLYNPNNVHKDAAPVTQQLELEAGTQLARMLGMATDTGTHPCAWGHLTSGGTVANYEALYHLRAARSFALALAGAGRPVARSLDVDGTPLEELPPWALYNLPLAKVLDLHDAWQTLLAGHSPGEAAALHAAVRDASLEQLGTAAFQQRHGLATPVVFAPITAHYSWAKSMQLLGLGERQLRLVPTDAHMRMDAAALAELAAAAAREQQPVLATVGVLGSTEFGTIDPIRALVELRDELQQQGLCMPVHVDAAWGGYLASMFRERDGSACPHDAMRETFRYFPSQAVYDAFTHLASADSVTVDPHKLGYVPYGSGALVVRDRRIIRFVRQRPAYLDDTTARPTASDDADPPLGECILEGSKPGAAAAAVWITHRMLPLDREHFGRLLRNTVQAGEYLYDRLQQTAEALAGRCRVVVPVEPDTNLLCIALNPAGNRSLAATNAFTRRVLSHLRLDAGQPIQTREFIGTHTSILRSRTPDAAAQRLCEALDVDAESFTDTPLDEDRDADHIFLLRHTLMNPWLFHGWDDANYMDRYCDHLQRLIIDALDTRA